MDERTENPATEDDLVGALLALPVGVFEGAHRYMTDDEHVLHLWVGGKSYDLRLARLISDARPVRDAPEKP